jgi:hypothetical protein
VVLPVPAMPFIQYTAGAFLSYTQLTRSDRTFVRVCLVHVRLPTVVDRAELYVACLSGPRA